MSEGSPNTSPDSSSGQKPKVHTQSSGEDVRHTSPNDYGYDFYPERRKAPTESFWQQMTEGRAAGDTVKCVSNVYWCYKKNPFIRLLVGALKSHGCDFEPSRHVSCEKCVSKVNGGYDPTNNQIVVCKNNSKSRDTCCSVISHELIHMFDFCRAKADFTNLQHLACTEIRAAALVHCSFIASMNDGDASYFNYKNKHQECVKKKAAMSVMLVRNITQEEAMEAVEKVFSRCYRDLEPFGRIPRKGSRDHERILSEATLYGYCD